MQRQMFSGFSDGLSFYLRVLHVVRRWMYLVESKNPLGYKRIVRQSNANQCDAAWPCAQAINLPFAALGKGRDSCRNLWS
jgi:hypothetical protein